MVATREVRPGKEENSSAGRREVQASFFLLAPATSRSHILRTLPANADATAILFESLIINFVLVFDRAFDQVLRSGLLVLQH